MDRRAVYLRTSKGLKELMGRTSLLGSADRNILFLLTGKASLGEIEARLDPVLRSRLQSSIEKLVREEFISVADPNEMGSETDITNGMLIDPRRSTAEPTRTKVAQQAEGLSTTSPALTADSDDQINAALRQAQNQSRRQSIVDRLHQVEHMASAAGASVASRKSDLVAAGAQPGSSLPGAAASGPSLSPSLVLSRTAKGAQEFIGRSQTFPPTLAKLLAFVDGEATVSSICARAGNGDGRVVGLGIQKLLRDGYVQEAMLAIKDLVPAEDFDQTVGHKGGLVGQAEASEVGEQPMSAAVDQAVLTEDPGAFGEVAKALADHAAMESRVAETAKQVIARAAAPSAPAPLAPVGRKLEPLPVLPDDDAKSRRRSRRLKHVEQDEQVNEMPALVHSIDPQHGSTESAAKRFKVPRWVLTIVALTSLVGAAGMWFWKLFDADHHALAASRYLGRPVAIGGVGVEFMPLPAIKFSDVRVGGGSSTLRVGKVNVGLVPAMLLDPGRALHDLRIHDIVITSDELRAVLGAAARDAGSLTLRKVEAHGVKIIDQHWVLDELALQANVGPQGRLTTLTVTGAQGDARVVFTPATTGVEFEITSSRMRPFGADFELHEFSARGTFIGDEVVVNAFDGRILQGVLKGQARIRTGATWTAEGTVEGRGMELSALAKSLMRDGQFSAKARFASSAATPAKLFATGTLEGSLSADHGTLLGVDISRVAQGEMNARGTTQFTELVASFRADAGLHQVASNVRFRSNKVGGTASIHLDAKQTLSGQVTGDLSTPSGTLRGSVNVSGSPARPVFGR